MQATAHIPISAEARGQLRLLRTRLVKQNVPIGEMFQSGSLRQLAKELVLRNSVLGRSRVLQKLRNGLGPGAHFEGAKLHGSAPIANWVFFAPRDRLPSVPSDLGLGQACITANYLLVGALPDGIGFDEAVWTIVFPDHALGRLFDRSRPSDPVTTMLEAHRNMLKARVSDVMPNFFGATGEFYLPASRGVFLCQLFATRIPVRGQDKAMLVFARTWLDDLDLRDDQMPIALNAAEGEEMMGDSFLLPLPLRLIFLPE